MREAQPLSVAGEHVGRERRLQPAARRAGSPIARSTSSGGVGQRRGEPQGVARLEWQLTDPAAEQRPDVVAARDQPPGRARARPAGCPRLACSRSSTGRASHWPVRACTRAASAAASSGSSRELERGPAGEATDEAATTWSSASPLRAATTTLTPLEGEAAEREREDRAAWPRRATASRPRRSARERTAASIMDTKPSATSRGSTVASPLLQQQCARHRVPLRVGQLRRAGRDTAHQLVEGGERALRLGFGGMGTEHPAARRRGNGREQRRLPDAGLAFDDHHGGGPPPASASSSVASSSSRPTIACASAIGRSSPECRLKSSRGDSVQTASSRDSACCGRSRGQHVNVREDHADAKQMVGSAAQRRRSGDR